MVLENFFPLEGLQNLSNGVAHLCFDAEQDSVDVALKYLGGTYLE